MFGKQCITCGFVEEPVSGQNLVKCSHCGGFELHIWRSNKLGGGKRS